MNQRRLSETILGLAAVALAACNGPVAGAASGGDQDQVAGGASTRPSLGLMSSLPLYWPLSADFADLAQGTGETPWQRHLLEKQFELTPLDTLTPIPALSPDEADRDPLAHLDYLAVIQPRGLSAADNVALDEWVRAGGRLLLVLDPMLTGDYDIPVGDPRRPADVALIPPVVKRWGLEVSFDEQQDRFRSVEVPFSAMRYGLFQAGEINPIEGAGWGCTILAEGVFARCSVGEGHVTLLADAGMFEHQLIIERDFTGEHQPLVHLLRFAFEE